MRSGRVDRAEMPDMQRYEDFLFYILDGYSKDRKMMPGRDTFVYLEGNRIVIRYKDTPVLTFTPDDKVYLDSGGWLSAPIKNRINDWLPHPYELRRIHRQNNWRIINMETGDSAPFEDGMCITLEGDGDEFVMRTNLQTAEQIPEITSEQADDYIARYLKHIENGTICACKDEPSLEVTAEEVNNRTKMFPPADRMLMLINSYAYPPSLLRRAMLLDSPHTMYFKVMEEVLTLPEYGFDGKPPFKRLWKTDKYTLIQSMGVFRRVLRRMIRKSLGLPV